MPPRLDYVGKRFGRLIAIEPRPAPSHTCGRNTYWKCVCSCGTETLVTRANLQSGHTRSCGCLLQETITTHGKSGSSEYCTWDAMIQRCTNPNSTGWAGYGGRGIIVCQGMREFAIFYKVMGDRPQGYQLDRKNNEGSYTCGSCAECLENDWPMNCRWVTPKQNSRNTRTNRRLTYKGETHTVVGWSERLGLNQNTIRVRLFDGDTDERALRPVKC